LTGGGPENEKLSESEQRVLGVIGMVCVEGVSGGVDVTAGEGLMVLPSHESDVVGLLFFVFIKLRTH